MITLLDKQLDLASYFTPIGHQPAYLRELAEELRIGPAITDVHLSMIDAAALRGKAAAYEKHARALAADPDEDYDRAFGPDLAPAKVLTPATMDAPLSASPPPPAEMFPTVTPAPSEDRAPGRRKTPLAAILDLMVNERALRGKQKVRNRAGPTIRSSRRPRL